MTDEIKAKRNEMSFEYRDRPLQECSKTGRLYEEVARIQSWGGFLKGFDAAWSLAEQTMVSKEIVEKLEYGLADLVIQTGSTIEDMQHCHENKCVPTEDEVNQIAIAYTLAKKALADYHAAMKDEK